MSRVALLLSAIALGLATSSCRGFGETPREGEARLDLLPDEPRTDFARAKAPREFRLPLDHGPHFEFETEWWYYTGNLAAKDGRRFGFQLTFFRRGLSPGAPKDSPGLKTNQIYFAHFALTDVGAARHVYFERWSRGASGLAGAEAEPYHVWLEDWGAEGLSPDGSEVRLRARNGRSSVDLLVKADKPLVRHGKDGLSTKSAVSGNASYYVGYTRMSASGTLETEHGPAEVLGTAWFDHEWSTSALGADAVGWDWFSLQMDDARELMFFRIRRADGSIDTVSGGTIVEPDGQTRRLAAADVVVEVLARWTSPQSGASYPVKWRLRAPAASLDLEIDRRLDAQEMRTSFTYWEGAVSVRGTSAGRATSGVGYVELTGYAGTMKGVF